jgi:hypothetical protein
MLKFLLYRKFRVAANCSGAAAAAGVAAGAGPKGANAARRVGIAVSAGVGPRPANGTIK